KSSVSRHAVVRAASKLMRNQSVASSPNRGCGLTVWIFTKNPGTPLLAGARHLLGLADRAGRRADGARGPLPALAPNRRHMGAIPTDRGAPFAPGGAGLFNRKFVGGALAGSRLPPLPPPLPP